MMMIITNSSSRYGDYFDAALKNDVFRYVDSTATYDSGNKQVYGEIAHFQIS